MVVDVIVEEVSTVNVLETVDRVLASWLAWVVVSSKVSR